MRIAIIGANGYIGSKLREKLDNSNIEYISFDVKDNSKIDYLTQYESKKAHKEIERTIKFFNENTVDCVVHLGNISGIKQCEQNPIIASYYNVQSNIQVLNACLPKTKLVLFASSGSADFPNTSIYASYKSIMETYIDGMNRIYNNKILPMRFSNVYSKDALLYNKTSLIANLYAFKENNLDSFRINGNGNQERDFINVDDVTDFILNCSKNEDKVKKYLDTGNKYINVCTGQKHKINDIVNEFFERYNIDKSKIIYDEKSNHGVDTVNTRITDYAKYILNFSPKHSILNDIRNF